MFFLQYNNTEEETENAEIPQSNGELEDDNVPVADEARMIKKIVKNAKEAVMAVLKGTKKAVCFKNKRQQLFKKIKHIAEMQLGQKISQEDLSTPKYFEVPLDSKIMDTSVGVTIQFLPDMTYEVLVDFKAMLCFDQNGTQIFNHLPPFTHARPNETNPVIDNSNDLGSHKDTANDLRNIQKVVIIIKQS